MYVLGEITTLTKNTKKFDGQRLTIPISMVRQWNLHSGDKLDWSWESVNNEMVMIIRKPPIVSKSKTNLDDEEDSRYNIRGPSYKT